MSERIDIELPELPSLGGLYARAAFLPKSRPKAVDTLPSIRVTVRGVMSDAARLDRYRALCGFTDASRMPITWPQVLAAALQIVILVHPKFPLPAMGVVHLSQLIEEREPIRSDARLDLTCTIGQWEVTHRGLEFELITDASVDGAVAWRGVTRILGRLGATTAGTRPAPAGDPAAPESRPPSRSVCWSVGEDLGRRYGGVSGDYNPIHLWAFTARPLGFKRAIAQGMWLLARCAAELEDDVGVGARRLTAEFRRPVMLPSRVAFEARSNGAGGADFALLGRDAGRAHLVGSYSGLP